jgi:hypothetical protein
MLGALLVVVHLAGAPPLAQDPDFREALRLRGELEYEKAAVRLAELALVERPAIERARLFALLGIAYGEARAFGQARLAFDRALGEDPRVTLPTETSPRIAAVFDEAKAAHAAKPTTPPEPAPVAPPPAAAVTTVPWLWIAAASAGGLGVASAGVGLAFGALAQQDHDAAVAAIAQSDGASLRDRSLEKQSAANGLFIGAGAAGAVGVGLAVWAIVVGAE